MLPQSTLDIIPIGTNQKWIVYKISHLKHLFLSLEYPIKSQNGVSIVIVIIVREWGHSKYYLIMNANNYICDSVRVVVKDR